MVDDAQSVQLCHREVSPEVDVTTDVCRRCHISTSSRCIVCIRHILLGLIASDMIRHIYLSRVREKCPIMFEVVRPSSMCLIQTIRL